MSTTNSGANYYGTTIHFSFGGQNLPSCTRCRGPITGPRCYRDQFGRVFCESCKIVIERAVAHSWVDDLFAKCPPVHRKRLRRALSIAFHPDQGGDADIMVLINRAAEKFKV